MRLLLDPDLGLDGAGRSGLAALAKRYETIPTRFGYYPADESSPATPRCDRCNLPLHRHVWMLLDDDNTTFNCETRES